MSFEADASRLRGACGGDARGQLPVHIRWMIRRDMPEVLAIEESCFLDDPWDEDKFIRELRVRNNIALVAEHDERIVGYMVYQPGKRWIDILNFAVHPGCWRRKVGTRMVEKLAGKLDTNRRNRLTACVREENLDGQLFFKAMGFQAISETVERDGVTGYTFVYRLRNEVFRIAE